MASHRLTWPATASSEDRLRGSASLIPRQSERATRHHSEPVTLCRSELHPLWSLRTHRRRHSELIAVVIPSASPSSSGAHRRRHSELIAVVTPSSSPASFQASPSPSFRASPSPSFRAEGEESPPLATLRSLALLGMTNSHAERWHRHSCPATLVAPEPVTHVTPSRAHRRHSEPIAVVTPSPSPSSLRAHRRRHPEHIAGVIPSTSPASSRAHRRRHSEPAHLRHTWTPSLCK